MPARQTVTLFRKTFEEFSKDVTRTQEVRTDRPEPDDGGPHAGPARSDAPRKQTGRP